MVQCLQTVATTTRVHRTCVVIEAELLYLNARLHRATDNNSGLLKATKGSLCRVKISDKCDLWLFQNCGINVGSADLVKLFNGYPASPTISSCSASNVVPGFRECQWAGTQLMLFVGSVVAMNSHDDHPR